MLKHLSKPSNLFPIIDVDYSTLYTNGIECTYNLCTDVSKLFCNAHLKPITHLTNK